MSNVIGLSDEREANLRTLAAYLRRPSLLARFTMSRFSACDRPRAEEETVCGTAGCAVGHGPYAGIPKRTDEDWQEYSHRVFLPWHESAAWEWCFDACWVNRDNSPDGAASRIEWLLDKGLPDDWYEQLYREAPLCYREGAAP